MPAPLTTSIRGLWVSGLLPPGNGGNERRSGDPKNRPSDTKGRRPKNRPAKGGTLEATWMRGEGTPRTLASWRHLFSASCRGNCLRFSDKFQADTLRDGMSLVGFRNLSIAPFFPVRVTYLVDHACCTGTGTRFLEFVYWLSLLYTNAPGLFGGRGEMAMAVPRCHSSFGTACAFGLTWRPLTGSLYLSSFWCRLKPGPSGERGRKSGLLQDMLVTGLGPTSVRVDGRVQAWTRLALDSFKFSNPVWRATGHNEPVDGRVQTWTRHGRAIIPRTDGQRPKDRSVTIDPQGWETVFGRYPRQYAVVLTYYWVRGRVTSLVGLFVFPFVLFGHFFVFRGPGAGASGHTGSLPGCAERGVLCPGGG